MQARIGRWRGTSMFAMVLLMLGFGVPSTLARAQEDLQGAQAILGQVEAARSQAAKQQAAAPNLRQAFQQQLQDFREQANTLQPNEASRRWLALVDEYSRVSNRAQEPDEDDIAMMMAGVDERDFSFREVMQALPPPAAWPALAASIKQRHAAQPEDELNGHLLILSHLLTNDKAAVRQDLKAIQARARAQKNGQLDEAALMNQAMLGGGAAFAAEAAMWQDAAMASTYYLTLSSALAQLVGDKAGTMEAFNLQWNNQSALDSAGQRLAVPDLVALAGPAEAEAMLRRVLTSSTLIISVDGEATLQLARRLALKHLTETQLPQWELIGDDEPSVQLYEAFEKRFYGDKRAALPNGWDLNTFQHQYNQARYHYWKHLIKAERISDAVNLIVADNEAATDKLTYNTGNRLGNNLYLSLLSNPATELPRHLPQLYQFTREVLMRKPELPYWGLLISVAAHTGQGPEAIAMLRQAADNPELEPSVRRGLSYQLHTALLSNDQVEDGVGVLRRLITTPMPDKTVAEALADRMTYAQQLVTLGNLLENPAWTEEGLDFIRQNAMKATLHEYILVSLSGFLVENEEAPLAEQLLGAGLKRAAQQKGSAYELNPQRQLLVALAGLYHRTGRHQDVLTLLEASPDWGAADLAEIITATDGSTPLVYMAAVALNEAGRTEEALRVLQALLSRRGGYDPAYQLLVEMQGEEALPLVETLYQADRFEERPLIWKATLLLGDQKLEEAEKVVRLAISIDPSDGEQPRGDRMRAYGVLAEIRAARGDLGEASMYQDVLEAIRLAEEADRFYAAGMLERGIEMYEKSLLHFADAYCIQSRLAVQLMQQGRVAEAEVHYRKAYELMPDSFGRMESHCFGCESIFKGKQAESIAEQTFSRLAREQPDKPQVHYLLGYLREEQRRYPEALESYHRAVQLDPDYINAWQRLQGLDEHTILPSEVQDEATFALLRLDPTMRHTTPDLAQVSDLARLWRAAESAVQHQVTSPQTIFPLPASATAVEKRREELIRSNPYYAHMMEEEDDEYLAADDYMYEGGYTAYTNPALRWKSPGESVAAHPALTALSTLIDLHSGGLVTGWTTETTVETTVEIVTQD